MQFVRSYFIHKVIWLRLDWMFKNVTQGSTSNLAEILMWRTSLPVKLHDAGKFWGIIIFTRSSNILPFDHDLVQKVKKVRQSQHQNRPRFWCGEYLCKVTTWCMQLMWSYCVHKATWPWASLKVQKGDAKVNMVIVWYVDVKNIPIKLQHHTSNTWEVTTRQLDLELVWKFKKATQRSTSNWSEILMWRTLL